MLLGQRVHVACTFVPPIDADLERRALHRVTGQRRVNCGATIIWRQNEDTGRFQFLIVARGGGIVLFFRIGQWVRIIVGIVGGEVFIVRGKRSV